jgi:hypothetical protein
MDDRLNICGRFTAPFEDVKRGLNDQLFMDRAWDVLFPHDDQKAGFVKHLRAEDWQWFGGVSWTEKLWPFKDLHLVLYQNPDRTLPAAAHVEPDDHRDMLGHGLMAAFKRCRNWNDVKPGGFARADYYVGTVLFLNIIQQRLPRLHFELSNVGTVLRSVKLLRR